LQHRREGRWDKERDSKNEDPKTRPYTYKVDRVITHDKGTSIFDVGKRIRENQIDIRHKHDLISTSSRFETGGKDKITTDDGKTNWLAVTRNIWLNLCRFDSIGFQVSTLEESACLR
jgi:hypothetical protein